MHRLRTLDVWDTLLRRKCHPDLIKLVVARHLLLSHGNEVAEPYRDQWALLRERCLIEGELARAAAARGKDDEYSLEQVFSRLLERVSSVPVEAREQRVEELIATEVEIEKANTFADPECREQLAAYPAERTLFLSDFYMPASLISELLAHHGLDDLAPEGLSSCDLGLNKRSGRLFGHVHATYGVAPEQHVHIGDNAHSDHRVPAALGVRTVHYLPERPHAEREQREGLFRDRAALLNHIDHEVAQLAEPAAAELRGVARTAFLLGTRCAPLYVGYALFTAERALTDRLQQLYFLTREGEFFIEVYRRVLPEGRLAGIALPPAQVLEVSRLATFCASLQEVGTGEMMRLWNLYSTQSMMAMIKSLGIDPARVEPLCARHGIAIADPVVYPWKDARVQELFADPEFQTLIGAQVEADRALLLDYLAARGLGPDCRRVGIVDIGWRGTIQDNLALLLPDRTVFGYYLGLARFLNPQPANCCKAAYGPDLNRALDFSHFLDAVSPIEMLSNSPHGSTEGYRREADGRVIARRNVDPEENQVHASFVAHFQRGVLLAGEQWGHYADNHAITADELRGHACEIWDTLISRSPQELSDAYASLSHNEVFGVGHFVDKSAVPSISSLLLGVFDRRRRYEVIQYIKQTQWNAGLWKRSDLGLVHKCLLSAALVAGRAVKIARLRWRLARAGRAGR